MRVSWKHVAVIVAALVTIGTMGWFLLEDSGVEAEHLWFYDIKSGELFVGDGKAVPPIEAPSDEAGGASGVLASVFKIDGDDTKRIAFLQTYTPEARELRIESLKRKITASEKSALIGAGTLVALVPKFKDEPIKWVPAGSPEGMGVLMTIAQLAGGKTYQANLP